MGGKSATAPFRARLAVCEQIIENGFETFVEVGEALIEIRDSKLYRDTHKTFAAYCRERWDFGRSRAYQLIDHAKVARAVGDAIGEVSENVDISERDVRAIKGDVEAVVEDIKARRAAGEGPEDAAKNAIEAKRKEQVEEKRKAQEAAAEAKRQREAEQAENDRVRDEPASQLPAFVAERETAKANAIAARQGAGAEPSASNEPEDADRIAELEEAVRALEAENNRLKASLAEDEELERMRADWRAGGWDKVVEKLKADHAFDVGVLKRQVETESADKVGYMRRGDFFKRQAEKLGWSNTEEIDIPEGARG